MKDPRKGSGKWAISLCAPGSDKWPHRATDRQARLVLLRKMRFMACYTLPAPIAIDKNIRKATLHRRLSVSTPYHGQPTRIGEIAIHPCMQVREFDCWLNLAPILGTRQHCWPVDQCAGKVSLFEFIRQNAPQRSHVVLLHSSQPDVFDLN